MGYKEFIMNADKVVGARVAREKRQIEVGSFVKVSDKSLTGKQDVLRDLMLAGEYEVEEVMFLPDMCSIYVLDGSVSLCDAVGSNQLLKIAGRWYSSHYFKLLTLKEEAKLVAKIRRLVPASPCLSPDKVRVVRREMRMLLRGRVDQSGGR